MADSEHVKIVRRGAAAIAEWQRRNPQASLDLSGADLTGVDLLWANLFKADLTGAVLCWARLFGADLIQARLAEANLTRADLTSAALHWADLTGANLNQADLFAANLTGAHLRETNLAEAHFDFTSLGYCDLSGAKGLSSVNHDGPSSIGVETLILSFGRAGNRLTPDLETFFLGAGVDKEFLEELPRIVGEVEYYSCFISYGRPDLEFATKLRGGLVASGVSCWLYDLDATPGERTWPEITQARREADKMVVICSVATLIRDGALKEIEEQIDEDPDKMIPISRDNDWTQPGFRVVRGTNDLKPFLLDKNYADFSDDARYEDALQSLLKALRRKAE